MRKNERLAERLYDEGTNLYEDKKYKEAEIKLKEALDILPDSEDIMYNLALTYFEQGKYQDSISIINNIQKLDCDDLIEELKKKGIIYEKSKVISDKNKSIFTISKIPMKTINEVVKLIASRKAINSLILWGVINLILWLLLGGEFTKEPFGEYHPNMLDYLLYYTSLFLGLMMISISLYFTLSKTQLIILLDGVFLIIIGIWNILFRYIAIIGGYNFKEISSFWNVLGVAQLIWGINRIKFGKYIGFDTITLDKSKIDEAEKIIKNFINMGPVPGDGHFKFSIPLRFFNLDKSGDYLIYIKDDNAICIKSDISLYFLLSKKDKDKWKLKKNNSIKLIDINRSSWKVVFEEISYNYFKSWAGF